MDKQKIRDYISRSEIQKALGELECDNIFLYRSRWSRLESQKRKGILSLPEYNLEYNSIVNCILDEIGAGEMNNVNDPITTFQDQLSQLITKSKRPNPEVNSKANNLFDEYQVYLSNKANDSLFDNNGRRLNYFDESLNSLQKEFDDFKDEVKSSLVEEIRQLLSEPLPSDEKIKLALDKCTTRGFKLSYPVDLTIMSKFDKFDLIEEILDFCKQ